MYTCCSTTKKKLFKEREHVTQPCGNAAILHAIIPSLLCQALAGTSNSCLSYYLNRTRNNFLLPIGAYASTIKNI